MTLTPPPAGDSLAELRLAGPEMSLCCRLSGPTLLVQAVATAFTRLLAPGPRPEKRVALYLALLALADQTGRCRAYQDQLAALVGVSTRHLRRLLADLAAAGLVQIQPSPRPQPNGYFLPLLAVFKESANSTQPDSTLSAKEELTGQKAESAMSHEHDEDFLPDKINRHLEFLHEGQRQERLAQPHCTPAFLQAWDDWWGAGRFGRLRNPAGWANLQIKQGRWPPVAPTPLPLLATPVEPPPTGNSPAAPTAEDVFWGEILTQLRSQMTRATFDTWLKGTRLAAREGDCFTIAVPSGFARDWLEHRLQGVIRRTIAQATGLPPGRLELLFRVGAPIETH